MSNDILAKAALLHDIGKICYRSDSSVGNHSKAGADFLQPYLNNSLESEQILHCIKYHHANFLRNASVSNDDFCYLIYEADNIASGLDRRKIDDSNVVEGISSQFQKDMALSNIFSAFGNSCQTISRYPLQGLEPKADFPMPISNQLLASSDKYKQLVEQLKHNFQQLDLINCDINEILRIIEDIFSYIPSSTNTDELADISLYMHSKMTAAIACCMKLYFDDKGINDYKSQCYSMPVYRTEESFLLVSGDISGIQEFIYTIPSKGALKSLRGRSFYLELLMEVVIDEILTKLNLSRANLLYSGGGHFYLLAPCTESCKNAIREIQAQLNDWLLEKLGTKLYLAIGYTPCTANMLLQSDEQRNMFSAVSQNVAKDKLNRYTESELKALFDDTSLYNDTGNGKRECSICRTSVVTLQEYADDEGLGAHTDELGACPMCAGLYQLGKSIISNDETCFIVADRNIDTSLYLAKIPIFTLDKNCDLYVVKINDIEKLSKIGTIKNIYVKNAALTGKYVSTRLWIADYSAKNKDGLVKSFEILAKQSGDEGKGINRLGVLRADVDNLGAAFISGFVHESKGILDYTYATFSRYAELSRSLSMFFKLGINTLCKKQPQRNLHVVYAGGDDIFVVGAWTELIEFAIELRHMFSEFTDNKLSFSAGLALFPPKYPISRMAEITGELESVAKDNPEKDSLALFGFETAVVNQEYKLTCNHVHRWKDFENQVLGDKLNLLEKTFGLSGEVIGSLNYGKSFLYRLMDIIEAINQDELEGSENINLARFLYMLARMQPEKNNKEQTSIYIEFSSKMYEWIRDKKSRNQLLTAIHIIVYKLRDKKEI